MKIGIYKFDIDDPPVWIETFEDMKLIMAALLPSLGKPIHSMLKFLMMITCVLDLPPTLIMTHKPLILFC